jgi:tripartite-type tricarboxylate transporter receptor subunit TctC
MTHDLLRQRYSGTAFWRAVQSRAPIGIACASRSARLSGVAGNIGAQAVIGSQPDGYRLLVVTTAGPINATLYPRLPFNFLRDVAPVARLVRMVNLVVVHPSIPANTLGEFIAPIIEKSGIKGSH